MRNFYSSAIAISIFSTISAFSYTPDAKITEFKCVKVIEEGIIRNPLDGMESSNTTYNLEHKGIAISLGHKSFNECTNVIMCSLKEVRYSRYHKEIPTYTYTFELPTQYDFEKFEGSSRSECNDFVSETLKTNKVIRYNTRNQNSSNRPKDPMDVGRGE